MPDRWLRTGRKRIIEFTEYLDWGYRSVVESLPSNSEPTPPLPPIKSSAVKTKKEYGYHTLWCDAHHFLGTPWRQEQKLPSFQAWSLIAFVSIFFSHLSKLKVVN